MKRANEKNLHLVALPGVVDGNCEVERLVFHLSRGNFFVNYDKRI